MDKYEIEDFVRGWFVGNFEPSLNKNSSVEVGFRTYNNGDVKPEYYHVDTTEINLIVRGSVSYKGRLYKKGDIVVLNPGEKTDFKCTEDSTELIHIRAKKDSSNNSSSERFAKQYFKNSTPLPNLWRFEVHIADSCNLNCRYCTHYSNIAKTKFCELNTFESDFKRLSELTEQNVNIITLLGGEPLLNPDVCKYIKIARSYFRKSIICLTTNGILLPKMSSEFWQTLKENSITLKATKYPVNVDWDYIFKKCKEYQIDFEYQKEVSEIYKIPINLHGKTDPFKNWSGCKFANNCIFLRAGRLYTCTQAANIDVFNEYYHTDIPNVGNSIDIYKAQSIEEVLHFLAKPIPFCSYCDFHRINLHVKWSRGKPALDEWIN